jgi:uncharacterized protein YlxW (UPF0749 family)
LFAIAGVLASTSFAHAIDQNPSARATAEQQVASQVNDLSKQVTRMQDQIAQLNEELVALRAENSGSTSAACTAPRL